MEYGCLEPHNPARTYKIISLSFLSLSAIEVIVQDAGRQLSIVPTTREVFSRVCDPRCDRQGKRHRCGDNHCP